MTDLTQAAQHAREVLPGPIGDCVAARLEMYDEREQDGDLPEWRAERARALAAAVLALPVSAPSTVLDECPLSDCDIQVVHGHEGYGLRYRLQPDREPVDRELLADTIHLYGTAIEYKGQVFNPVDVFIHTNGTTDARRVSLIWSVVNRWTRPDCAPTTDEARQLLSEVREMLTGGQPLSDCVKREAAS